MLCLPVPRACISTPDSYSPQDEIVDVGGTESLKTRTEKQGMNLAFTTRNAANVTHKIHGTDLPSQTVSGAGHGMVR